MHRVLHFCIDHQVQYLGEGSQTYTSEEVAIIGELGKEVHASKEVVGLAGYVELALGMPKVVGMLSQCSRDAKPRWWACRPCQTNHGHAKNDHPLWSFYSDGALTALRVSLARYATWEHIRRYIVDKVKFAIPLKALVESI